MSIWWRFLLVMVAALAGQQALGQGGCTKERHCMRNCPALSQAYIGNIGDCYPCSVFCIFSPLGVDGFKAAPHSNESCTKGVVMNGSWFYELDMDRNLLERAAQYSPISARILLLLGLEPLRDPINMIDGQSSLGSIPTSASLLHRFDTYHQGLEVPEMTHEVPAGSQSLAEGQHAVVTMRTVPLADGDFELQVAGHLQSSISGWQEQLPGARFRLRPISTRTTDFGTGQEFEVVRMAVIAEEYDDRF